MTEHDALRELSAAYVIGALEAEERSRFEAHLAECSECRHEVASFAPVPGLLARIGDPGTVRTPERVLQQATARVQTEWVGLERRLRRWRLAAVVSAVVAIVVGVLGFFPAGDDGDATVIRVASESISGEVSLDPRGWGTAVHLDLRGLPQRPGYAAWLVDGAGGREQAAQWGPTPAGAALLDGASALETNRVVAVLVTDVAGEETLLRVDASQG